MECTCASCGKVFIGRDQRHRYCSDLKCQRMRKRQWQQHALATDASYRGNQADARKRWQQEHPHYWKRYRKEHPRYESHNREEQRKRNRRRRKTALPTGADMIANMDATIPIKSGTYRLVSVDGSMIANMDMVVELSLISKTYAA